MIGVSDKLTPAARIALTEGLSQVSDLFPPKLHETTSAPRLQLAPEWSYRVGHSTHWADEGQGLWLESGSDFGLGLW